MKTPERFNRAIKALVTAFFDETLAKGNCAACAVGNIVAEAYGERVSKKFGRVACEGESNTIWKYLFLTERNGTQYRNSGGVRPTVFSARKLIKKTGYNEDELAKVEHAFERNTAITFDWYCVKSRAEIMEDQFKGLVAVVDVLCQIEWLDSAPYKKAFEYSEQFKQIHVEIL